MSFYLAFLEAKRKWTLPLPLQAFADDSGGIGTTRTLTLAGFFGEASAVATFADDWKAALAAKSAIEYFKLHELMQGRGQFENASFHARAVKAVSLCETIKRHPINAFVSPMDLDAFKVTLYTSKPSAFSKPLMLAYQNTIGSLAEGLWTRGVREPFEMIFDRQPQIEPRFTLYYANARESIKRALGPASAIIPSDVVFRDDKEFVPLQAADMLSGLLRHTLDGHLEGKDVIRDPMVGVINDALGDLEVSTLNTHSDNKLYKLWDATEEAFNRLMQMSPNERAECAKDADKLADLIEGVLRERGQFDDHSDGIM